MKKILITGAGRGIGFACTQKFVEEGWSVIAHCRQSSNFLNTLQKKTTERQLTLVKADFLHDDQLKTLLTFLKRNKVDALINNAAMYDGSKKKRMRMKSITDVLKVNVIIPTLIAESVFRLMKRSKGGHIINISSIAAKYGSNLDSIFYGISKRGLEATTKSLARVGANHHICVNTIRPGVVDTEFIREIDKNLPKRKKMIPMRRLAQPQEIAELAYYMVTKNTFMTNQIITIAGGE